MLDQERIRSTTRSFLRSSARKGETWEQDVVDRLTVAKRLNLGERVVQTAWSDGAKYVMHLCKDDCIEMDDEMGAHRGIYVIKKFSKTKTNNCVVVKPHNDARLDKNRSRRRSERTMFILTPNRLRERRARKVTITPMGQIVYENHDRKL